MGFWSGIKYALNSTVGTASFRPLDNMIADVKATVIGQRTLAASDSVIKVLLSTRTPVSNILTNVGTFTPKVSGSVRISGDFSMKSGAPMSGDLLLAVYLGTQQIAETSVTFKNSTTSFSATRDLSVIPGNTYTVKIYSSARVEANSVNVCANIIDTSLVG